MGCPVARLFGDLPDDSELPQVRLVYALPADGIDERLDIDGSVCTSALSFQTWFAGQAGGRRLRLDTHDGVLDVLFARRRMTDAEIRQMGPFVRDAIEADLLGAPGIPPHKIFAVYYGGSSDFACGGGAYPPNLVGQVAAMYLKGTPPGAVPCSNSPVGAALSPPGYIDFGMLHEILHTLGFVAACAPHQHRAGHVSEPANDLMWAGVGWWQLPALLDVGRDDYFDHDIPGCLDLADSAFLEPLPAFPTMPPGWPAWTVSPWP